MIGFLTFIFSAGPKGGPEGHVPPEEAKSAFKNDKKPTFFHILLKEKVRKGGGSTDRAVTPACK